LLKNHKNRINGQYNSRKNNVKLFSEAAGLLAARLMARSESRQGSLAWCSNSNYGLKRLRDAGREDIFFILRLDRPVFF
jgi:hypothetical protein